MSTNPETFGSKASTPRTASRALRTIVAGGLAAGAFDITYAFIAFGMLGMTPIRVGQSVAAGALGRDVALAGGVATGLLGLVLHFLMAIVMAAVYYAAATVLPVLVKRAVICGLVYGAGIYVVMNYVVMPLSAIHATGGSGPPAIVISGIIGHMVGVGLVIALFTRRGLRA